MAAKGICSIDNCGKRVIARLYCSAHYNRWRRHGDPLGGLTPDGAPMQFVQMVMDSETDECVLWPYGHARGYGYIHVGQSHPPTHRYVCELKHGPPPNENLDAAHRCGIKLCCNPRHIRWATRQENCLEKHEHGTMRKGANHHWSKFSPEDVAGMRRLEGVITQGAIARKYGASRSYVSMLFKQMTRAGS